MKRLLVATIAAASIAANAATFKENLTAGDIAAAAMQLNYNTNNTMLVTTPELAKQLYTAACATQAWYQADVAANIAYMLGDKATMQAWLDLAATLKSTGQKKVRCFFDTFGQSKLDPAKLGSCWKEFIDWRGVKQKERLSFTVLEPEMVFAFCKKTLAAGNIDAATCIFNKLQTNWYNIENGKATWMPYVTADWHKFIADNFSTAAQVEALEFHESIFDVLNYWRNVEHQDYIAGNKDALTVGVKTTPLCTTAILTKMAKLDWIETLPATIDVNKKYWAIVCEVGNMAKRIKAAKNLDKYAKNKAASKAIFQFVAENTTWSKTADFALYIGDADILLDTFAKIDTTATAAQIDAALPIFNSLDAGYRSADLTMALKNINKKYTIKLYDDRATWEPILSKVRAMLDTL